MAAPQLPTLCPEGEETGGSSEGQAGWWEEGTVAESRMNRGDGLSSHSPWLQHTSTCPTVTQLIRPVERGPGLSTKGETTLFVYAADSLGQRSSGPVAVQHPAQQGH